MNETAIPRLSAHALRQHELCPRLFALRYRLGRYWPAAEPTPRAHHDALALGQAFHQLVHWRSLGLDVAPPLAARRRELPALEALWRRFEASPFAQLDPAARMWTEQTLNLVWQGIPLQVRYDRIVKDASGWTIVDWKTGRLEASKLAESWQTRLYPFALAEAGEALTGEAIAPERIRMVYWAVETGETHLFQYDAARHQQVGAALRAIAARLTQPFDERLADDAAYPRNPLHCVRCPYDSHCNHAQTATEQVTIEPPRFVLDAPLES